MAAAVRRSETEVFRVQALNGECPRWSAAERKLYWCDMRAPALHRLDPSSGEDETWPMPEWAGCFVFDPSGDLIVALRDGLYRFTPGDGSLRRLADPPYDTQRFCFNDGGCDPAGRLYIGPMFAPKSPTAAPGLRTAPVWRFDGCGWTSVTAPVEISNGLAWSPDGRIVYHSDTPAKTIWAHDYDPATGDFGSPRQFATVDEGGPHGGPDGAAVDRDGFYLCAVFGAGCLLRFDPDGRLERRIPLPARYPTMPAFGGAALDRLFVTTASFPIPRPDRAAHPDDGALFVVEAPAPGPPPSTFQSPFNERAVS